MNGKRIRPKINLIGTGSKVIGCGSRQIAMKINRTRPHRANPKKVRHETPEVMRGHAGGRGETPRGRSETAGGTSGHDVDASGHGVDASGYGADASGTGAFATETACGSNRRGGIEGEFRSFAPDLPGFGRGGGSFALADGVFARHRFGFARGGLPFGCEPDDFPSIRALYACART